MNTFLKKIFYNATLGSALLSVPIFISADEPTTEKKEYPNGATLFYNGIGRGEVKKNGHKKHRDLGFSQSGLYAKHTERTSSGNNVSYGVGIQHNHFDWNHKKLFHQKDFDNLNLSIGGRLNEVEHWKIDANLALFINTDHFAISRYTLFTGFLQGQYAWKENMNLYVGLSAITGMRSSCVFPVLGFDYTYSDKLRFRFVLPYDIAAIYSFSDTWMLRAAVRTFYTHQRLQKKHEHHDLKRGLVTYRNTGIEIGLKYKKNERFEAGIHIGDAFSGRLRVSNHSNKDRKHYRIGSSCYVGAIVSIGF